MTAEELRRVPIKDADLASCALHLLLLAHAELPDDRGGEPNIFMEILAGAVDVARLSMDLSQEDLDELACEARRDRDSDGVASEEIKVAEAAA